MWSPVSFVVASDSHSNMYGRAGRNWNADRFGTDAAAVWATGEFWWQIPRSIQVVLRRQVCRTVVSTGKDVIITLWRALQTTTNGLNAGGRVSRGRECRRSRWNARLSISNMTTEWGPLVGMVFRVDESHESSNLRGRFHRRVKKTMGTEKIFRERHRELGEKILLLPRWPMRSMRRELRSTSGKSRRNVSGGPTPVQAMQFAGLKIEKNKVAIQKAF